ncbi:MAG: bifunctional adenosylcobinamide kinase/adenosylcobinamide-phosphate guanylyltransferase [Clostridia bacterium]
MFILVLGGSACGKSEFAEDICVKLGENQEKLYIATMQPFGEDAKFRIKRHQKLRASKGFDTLEKYGDLQNFSETGYHTILLECMSTLLGNEFFSEDYSKDKISLGVEKICENCENLVLISNNIFTDGIEYDSESMKYSKELAMFNREFAKKADVVIEVCCGIPIFIKGKEVFVL